MDTLEKNKKEIFISHSEKNADFVQILFDYLISLGIEAETIFCTSNYRSGVQDIISDEVFDSLKGTEIDIIILSNEYKRSEYCLNEAGVIRSKRRKSKKFIIALPNILDRYVAGFINEDHYQCRMSKNDFIEVFEKKLKDKLAEINLLNVNKYQEELADKTFREQTIEYIKKLPIMENLIINWKGEEDQRYIREEIKKFYEVISNSSFFLWNKDDPDKDVFYYKYARSINISKGKDPKKIKVKTTTEYIIINLSDEDIYQKSSAQFLKIDKAINTFTEKILVNDQGNSNLVTVTDRSESFIDEESPYIGGPVIKIKTKAHSSDKVSIQSAYEIEPEIFFQSKTISYPCLEFSLKASFEKNFSESQTGKKYIFRYQVIPPNPYNKQNLVIPRTFDSLENNKKSVFVTYNKGFPAGGGYAITMSKIDINKKIFEY